MTLYRARMIDSLNGNEGVYDFEDRDDLMRQPADEVVAAFFAYADRVLFASQHIAYELNGVLKQPNKKVVVAIGSLFRAGHEEDALQPFTLFIGKAKDG